MLTSQIKAPEELFQLSQANNYRENSLMLAAYYVLDSLLVALKSYSYQDILHDKLLLHNPLRQLLAQSGRSRDDVEKDVTLLEIMLKYGTEPYDFYQPHHSKDPSNTKKWSSRQSKAAMALGMLNDPLVRKYIGVNQYRDTWYFSKEGFEQLNKWLFNLTYLGYIKELNTGRNIKAIDAAIRESVTFFLVARRISANSGYRLQELTDSLSAIADL